YRVYQVTGSKSRLLPTLGASATSYQATGLTPAATVTFCVEAYNGSITADSANVSVTLPLDTPTLTATVSSSTTATTALLQKATQIGSAACREKGSNSALL